MDPTKKQILACWSLNCAVARYSGMKIASSDELLSSAKEFLYLLDQVKAHIEPPLKPDVGKSKAEKKDIVTDEVANDIEVLES